MLNKNQLIELVIKPTLSGIGLWSQDAENLLLMIAAHESKWGYYLAQMKGPARGMYQMEGETHDDIVAWVNRTNPLLFTKILEVCGMVRSAATADRMCSNLAYATAMARLFFLRFPEGLPSSPADQSAYAKKRWNTSAGKATADDYLKAYNGWK